MLALKIYLSGVLILIGAVVINGLAGLLGLPTWYTFLKSAGQQGLWDALRQLALVQALFLFVLYPAGLGLLVYAALRLFKL